MSTTKLQDDAVSDVNPKTIKTVNLVNFIATSVYMLAILACLFVWIWEEVSKPEIYMSDDFTQDPKFAQARYVLVMAYGVTLFMLILLQCCIQVGTNDKESPVAARRLIWSLIVALLFATYLGCVFLAFTYKHNDLDSLQTDMVDLLNDDFVNETAGTYSLSGRAFNRVQSKLGCCGISSAADYNATGFQNETGMPFPYSCCVLDSGEGASNVSLSDVTDWTQCQAESAEYFYSGGCYEEVFDAADYTCREIIVISSTAAILILLGTIIRLCAECYFERKHERYLIYLEECHTGHNGHQNMTYVRSRTLVTRQDIRATVVTRQDIKPDTGLGDTPTGSQQLAWTEGNNGTIIMVKDKQEGESNS